MNECVVAFLMMLLLGSGQTFPTLGTMDKDENNLSENQNHSNPLSKSSISSSLPVKTTNSEYICLDVPPNLPRCNFIRAENITQETETLSKSNERRKRDVDSSTSLIIYRIEGCIPLILPFRLPSCKPEESTDPTATIHFLRPFKPKKVYKETPINFPDINNTQWSEQMEQLKRQQSSSDQNNKLSLDSKTPSENQPNQRRDTKPMKSLKRKSKLLEKLNSNNMFDESHKKNIFNMKKSIHKTQKRIEEDIKKARGLDQELDKLVAELEFPYSRAIPFDPEKLQVARKGSEFPYSKAIPFNAEKLQVARERSFFPFWKDVLYRPRHFEFSQNSHNFNYDNELSYDNNLFYPKRSHHSRKLQSVEKNQEIFSNYFKSNDGSSRDFENSELLEKNNKQERETKTVVHRRESNYHHRPTRLWKKVENNRDLTFSQNEPHYLSRKLKFIQEGSEFPYPKAIPFDASKLVAARRKSELSKIEFQSKLMPDSKKHISRKPLAFNFGNSLSSLLLLPRNIRATIHHSKDHREKCC